MGYKSKRGRPERPVIAIPCEPVRKAGAKLLEFPSVKAAAAYFGFTNASNLSRLLLYGSRNLPTYGYFFDYKIEAYD